MTEHFLQKIVKINDGAGELCKTSLYGVNKHQRLKDKEIDFNV